MDKRRKTMMRRLLAGMLVLLGFSSCGNDDKLVEEYGAPHIDFQVKGTVLSEDEQPLKGIQVIVQGANIWNFDIESNTYYNSDTIYTDANGEFESKKFGSSAFYINYVGDANAYFNDVDGPENGGTFQSDSIALLDMEKTKVEEGENWYEGKYDYTTSVKLSKAEEETDD